MLVRQELPTGALALELATICGPRDSESLSPTVGRRHDCQAARSRGRADVARPQRLRVRAAQTRGHRARTRGDSSAARAARLPALGVGVWFSSRFPAILLVVRLK